MTDVQLLRQALSSPLQATDFGVLGRKYPGKVRDNYSTEDGRRYIITTDRVSAFDRVLGTLPLKGQVLQWVSNFWFNQTAEVAANHLLSVPDPNVIVAKECRPLGVEMVMRNYITGVTSTSMWSHYAAGKRNFCGHALPAGLRKDQQLEAPLLTPSSKAEKGGHDVSMSRDELIAAGVISAEDFEAAATIAHALFAFGRAHCAAHGLILVDTKYELGKAADGNICVIDEIHTPDSSRFWFAESYAERFAGGLPPESFDKEYLRRWLADQGFNGDGPVPEIPADIKVESMRRYIEACETIVGEPFVPNLEEPVMRMKKNLGIAGAA